MLRTYQTVDTEFNADSVEWCPVEGYRDLLLCGTYQLEENESSQVEEVPEGATDSSQVRIGRLHVYSLVKGESSSPQLKEQCQMDMPGVLDIKWSHQVMDSGQPRFALVNSVGEMRLMEVKEGGGVDTVADLDLDVQCLGLSLDWNNTISHCNTPQIAASDSTGSLTVCQVTPTGLETVSHWSAHDYEAWITAFNQWDPNSLWSGSDDCLLKIWDLRMEPKCPVFTSKRHTMGVCSIQSSPVHSHIVATGSYDEQLLIWDSRQLRQPLAETILGGGIWRIKWEPGHSNLILTATMYNGVHVVDAEKFCSGSVEVCAHYKKHESIGYGADWCRVQKQTIQTGCDGELELSQETSLEVAGLCEKSHDIVNAVSTDSLDSSYVVATCSFYDHSLHLWEFSPCHVDDT